jgi:hypothetical protein
MNVEESPIDLGEICENVAAISADFHTNANYDAIYESRGEEIGGFPGFWTLCSDAGIAFTAAQRHLNASYEQFEWIEAVDRFSDRIAHELWVGDPIPDTEMLVDLATQSIKFEIFNKGNRTPNG